MLSKPPSFFAAATKAQNNNALHWTLENLNLSCPQNRLLSNFPHIHITITSKMSSNDETDQQIEIFKVKKLIKNLEAAKGNGTSMISLILPPGSQISQVNKMLSDGYGTASNIKSRVNRLSVLGAITSTQQRLKLYNKCPKVSNWI